MGIISNASSDEMTSPFYASNKEICEKWEKFVLDHGGFIEGKYNAWSYSLKSEFSGSPHWFIDIKKATYTSGNLLLSSKYQSLQEIISFRAMFENTNCGNFCITRSIFKRKKQDHNFYRAVHDLLKDEINDKSLYMAQFKNNELTITVHHKNEGFDIAQRILEFKNTNHDKV